MALIRLAAKKQHGITLLELMIVVAVIGILAAIGYPAYTDQVRRSNRSEGKAMLQNAAALQERFFSNNNTYTTTVASLGEFSPSGKCTSTAYSENCFYELSIAAGAAGIGSSYELTATPKNGQTRDTKCTSMKLTNTGVKTGGGSQCNCSTAATCW